MYQNKNRKERIRNSLLYTITGVLFIIPVGLSAQTGGNVTVSEMLSDTVPERVSGHSIELADTGYNMQWRKAVSGLSASLSGEQIREIPADNITQALQGRLAGVELMQTSTKPGANRQIRIRGTHSLTGNDNLLVLLDGTPFAGSLKDINPNIIKNIDVLKDVSATAIYGSRGANGVILLTTYSGEQGSKAKISYNGYVGVKTLFAPFPMMDGPEYVALRKAAGRYVNTIDEADHINTNWQDLFYRNGLATSHNISIAGGMTKGSYYFGAGYTRSEALVPTQNFNRFSLHGSIEQETGKYFRFGITTTNSRVLTNGNNVNLHGVLGKTPIANPYNADGSIKRVVEEAGGATFVWTREVIEGLGDEYTSPSKEFGTYNSFYGELKIPGVEGLKYRLNAGLNYSKDNNGYYIGEGVGNATPATPSYTNVNNTNITNWIVENRLNYEHTFAGKHHLNATALFSIDKTSYRSSYLSVRDIPSSAFRLDDIARLRDEFDEDYFNQNFFDSKLLSWRGNVMYAYADRYMLSIGVHSDASSWVTQEQQWQVYPAVSAGWNINEEAFMKSISFINRLSLHAGYGKTPSEWLPTLELWNAKLLLSLNLKREYSETWNYSVDFSILKNRLSGTMEYYIKDTKDLLIGMSLPGGASGFGFTGNMGQIRNKGFELSLNGVILENLNGWKWEAGINLYANRNKLVALAAGYDSDIGNGWFTGYPMDVIYDYKKIGIWQEGDPYLHILEPGGNVGMIKVEYTGDYNPDGTPVRAINLDDRQIMSIEPNFQGGFNTRIAYKDFDLNVAGSFKNGGTLISALYGPDNGLNMLDGRRGQVKADYWMPENTSAKYPKPGGLMGISPKYGSTLAYFDASYLKVHVITLGYNFTQKWVKNAGIDHLRIYVTVQNPFVLLSPYHSETGMDPETNSYGNENIIAASYPARLLTIGVNSPATRNYLFGIYLTL
jgi:TonB-linked SusC/RagA family outer membrane protein